MFRNLFILLFVLIFWNCSSSSPTHLQPKVETETEIPTTSEDTETFNTATSGLDLDTYKSSLSDTYSLKENNIPTGYSRIKVEEDSDDEKDMFEGYRVQIYSGQNVAFADTVASIFRAWSDTTIVGYQAETYTFFKAPYYRVHVGDFHDKDRAIYFSNLLKRRFRDSWVVYDRIDPYNIPSDTTFIYTK